MAPVALGEVPLGVARVLSGQGGELHGARVHGHLARAGRIAALQLWAVGLAGGVEHLELVGDGRGVGEVAPVGSLEGQREGREGLSVVVLGELSGVGVGECEIHIAAQLAVVGAAGGQVVVAGAEEIHRGDGGGVAVFVEVPLVQIGEPHGHLAVLLNRLGQPQVQVPFVELSGGAIRVGLPVHEQLPVGDLVLVGSHVGGEIHLYHLDGLAHGVVSAAVEDERADAQVVADGAASDGYFGAGRSDVGRLVCPASRGQ